MFIYCQYIYIPNKEAKSRILKSAENYIFIKCLRCNDAFPKTGKVIYGHNLNKFYSFNLYH